MHQLQALQLLFECTGDHIWSVDYCRRHGIPEEWITELADCFESNFQQDDQTIYVGEVWTNQYHGVRDVDIAVRLGEVLGVDVAALKATAFSRADLVRAIQEAVEED